MEVVWLLALFVTESRHDEIDIGYWVSGLVATCLVERKELRAVSSAIGIIAEVSYYSIL